MTSPTKKPPIKFARRTSSGRIVSLSRDDDIDLGNLAELTSTSSGGASDYVNYTVLMPPTPDNQPYAAGPTTTSSASKPHDLPPPNGGAKRTGRRGGGREEDGGGGGGDGAKMERRMSVMKNNNKSLLLRSETRDFDHNRWLFETKGTYGIGNAFWPQDDGGYDEDGVGMSMSDFMDKPWKPLTRKVKIPSAVLSPYR